MFKRKIALVVPLLLLSCSSSKDFTGFSYDPPGVTNTKGAPVTEQMCRDIGIGESKVWVSNRMEGGRLSNFQQLSEDAFEVTIAPENAPINNSTWYAFRIWSEKTRTISLTLTYVDGRHRYIPKISANGTTYSLSDVEYDSSTGSATFPITISPVKKTISAQNLPGTRFSDLEDYIATDLPDFVTVKTAGTSNYGNPVYELIVDETVPDQPKKAILLLSRQHPPEISGYHTYQVFFERMLANDDLAVAFRKKFLIYAFPMLNPDGVIHGHWRHNAMGVDLNRDWKNFNQPETRAVRDALTPLASDPDIEVLYGLDFHSTDENLFYPINKEVPTKVDNFTQQWFPLVDADNPALNFRSEEFDTSSPISKNWMFKTFGCDALTFEVDDELTTAQIQQLGKSAAESFMKLMLDKTK